MDVYVHMCAGVLSREKRASSDLLYHAMHAHLLKAGSLADPGAQSFARLNLLASAWHLAISVPLPQALGIWNTTPYLSEARPFTWFLHGNWGFKLRFTH